MSKTVAKQSIILLESKQSEYTYNVNRERRGEEGRERERETDRQTDRQTDRDWERERGENVQTEIWQRNKSKSHSLTKNQTETDRQTICTFYQEIYKY